MHVRNYQNRRQTVQSSRRRKPFIDGAKVTATVEEQGKGEKILVFKYRAKVNYRKRAGHRQPFTAVKISGIQA